MTDRATVLIIDDDNEWLELFEEGLRPYFDTERASTVSEAQMIIANRGKDIQIALVDLRLKEDKRTKQSGLDALFLLRKQKIPCILVTAYGDENTIRDAFVFGKVSDVWFKKEDFVTLRLKIDEALKTGSDKSTDSKVVHPDLSAAERRPTSTIELDAIRAEIIRYKTRLIVVSVLIAILLIILIFVIPFAASWHWLIIHPKRLGMQISLSLIVLGILWAAIDTDERRRWFAFGSIIISAILTIAQII